MTSKAIITDEEGQMWLVVAGDPVWPAIASLRKQHRTAIVLPRAYIVRQMPVNPEVLEDHILRLGVAVASTTDAETVALVSAAYGRLACQHDCLTVVWQGTIAAGSSTGQATAKD